MIPNIQKTCGGNNLYVFMYNIAYGISTYYDIILQAEYPKLFHSSSRAGLSVIDVILCSAELSEYLFKTYK